MLPSGLELTVTSTVGLPPGRHRFGDLVVKKGGRLECHADTRKGEGVWIESRSLRIEDGGSITADAAGYPPGKGPAASGANPAGHAARGNRGAPMALGRGGKGCWGGGAIRIDTGEAVIDGTLTANGQSPNRDYSSGGAGGSIWLNCGALSGRGSIEARGGSPPKGAKHMGRGAGGRIGVFYRKSEFKGRCSAAGRGGKGTIVIKPGP
jgi:hypothetical protein